MSVVESMADKVPQLNDKFTKKHPKYQFVKKKVDTRQHFAKKVSLYANL